MKIHWYVVGDDDDPRWGYNRALYAYLAPQRAAIDYIGKCDGKTVRQRWGYDAKSAVWDCINQRTKHHHVIVGEFGTEERLTRKLVDDIESLLIYRVHQIQPLCNLKNTASRGNHWRPGMKVECRGAWPLSQKTFRDED
ncbi:MAG TPA: hypothetical protein VG206_17535 [Terriglobia bacterium]|nr:hypothetical protein [Terriglobia bacterium]